MRPSIRWWPSLLLALLLLLPGCAQRTAARGPRVGDPAPALTVAEWLRGGPVARFEPGKVYVIDIWAPWCVPCLGMMPELSRMQERYAAQGLVIVGLTGADDYGSTLENARRALADRGDGVRYAIAWDHERETYDRWMAIESRSGWPWCFVVDRAGRIAFTGHPGLLGDVIEPILGGTWNLDSARTVYAHRADALDRADSFMSAYRAGRFEDARRRYAVLLAFDRDIAGQYAASMFNMLLVKMENPGEAAAFARAALPVLHGDHVGTLVRMVEIELDDRLAPALRDLDLTLEIAERARSLAAPDDAGAIATVASVHARRGEMARAIEVQEQALAAAPPEDRAGFEETLARYRAVTP